MRVTSTTLIIALVNALMWGLVFRLAVMYARRAFRRGDEVRSEALQQQLDESVMWYDQSCEHMQDLIEHGQQEITSLNMQRSGQQAVCKLLADKIAEAVSDLPASKVADLLQVAEDLQSLGDEE